MSDLSDFIIDDDAPAKRKGKKLTKMVKRNQRFFEDSATEDDEVERTRTNDDKFIDEIEKEARVVFLLIVRKGLIKEIGQVIGQQKKCMKLQINWNIGLLHI